MKLARDALEATLTREDAEYVIEQSDNLTLKRLSPEQRKRCLELGKKDPRPFIERLNQSCQNLLVLCQSQEEQKRLVEEMQSSLADLELVLAVRRYGGRPKGKGRKVTPDEIENIRKWKHAGDRTWVSGSSVADVAKKLNVSRQTVYTILDEIKAEDGKRRDAPAVADEPS